MNRARLLFIRWLIKLSERNPLVIYVEDLHRADNASLDLLSTLVSENENLPLLLACTARPEFYKTRPSWGSGQRNHLRLDLRPLDKRESRDLVQEILQKIAEIPRSLRDLLVERAEGNPYYMEELVKMMIDNHIIVRESPELWRVEESRVGHIDLPTTLVGLLQARLDSLLYPERLTLQRAAVIGNIFYNTALVALDAADETHVSDLDVVLHHLAEREFIQVREGSAFEGSIEYTFNSNMVREMLLATLVSRQVTTYYTAAAHWLVAISGGRVNEYNALIAQYHEKAGGVTHASEYLRRAGERALSISAYEEARSTFEHMLQLLPTGHPEISGVTIQLGVACYYLAEYTIARQYLQAGLQMARINPDPQKAAQALYWLSQISNETEGNYEEAETYLEEGLKLARSAQTESSLEARILYGLGDVCWRRSNISQARDYCEQSIKLAQQLGDINTELYALNRIGTFFWPNDPETAGSFFQQVYDKAITNGNRERAAHALNNLGNVFMIKGDLVSAKSFIEQALALMQEIGQQQHASAGWMLDSLIDISLKLGDTVETRRYVSRMLKLAQQTGQLPLLIGALLRAGSLILRERRLDDYGLSLLGLVINHPVSSDPETKREITDTFSDLDLDPNDPRVLTGMEKGKGLDLDETVNNLLVEFSH
jgi:tetratricopeptide (TPR) repeat protein